MNLSWFQLVKAAPEARDALQQVGSKGWMSSKSIWYQLIKSGVTVLAAVGLYGVMSEQEIETISAGLAVAVPVVCTLFDAAAAIWLRLRTGTAISGTAVAGTAVAGTVTAKRIEDSGGVPGEGRETD